MPLVRRKRLPDGNLGPLEKVFEGLTPEEKIAQLEAENGQLKNDLTLAQEDTLVALEGMAQLYEELLLKGVI